jgi:hypothetical protein
LVIYVEYKGGKNFNPGNMGDCINFLFVIIRNYARREVQNIIYRYGTSQKELALSIGS